MHIAVCSWEQLVPYYLQGPGRKCVPWKENLLVLQTE